MFKFRYHILLASFLLSAVLWLSLNLNQTYEIQKTVPVKINVNKPLAVSGNIPLNLEVKFRGIGWDLIRLFTSLNLEFTYEINTKTKEQFVVLTKDYLVNNLLMSKDLQIISVYPETLHVKVESYEEKYVKLHPKLTINCKEGYQVVGNPELNPDSIKIGGAIDILRGMDYFNTRHIIFDNVNAGIFRKIFISDTLSNILNFSQQEIDLKVYIEPTAEKLFNNIEIKITELPADKEVLLIPQTIDVQLKGGVNQLAKIESSGIIPKIDYRKILADSTGSLKPEFVIPAGSSVISVKPETIQYVIKKKY